MHCPQTHLGGLGGNLSLESVGTCPCRAPLHGIHQRGTLLRGPMLLAAGGAVAFFAGAMLVTPLTARFVLVLGGVSLSITFVSLFLGLGQMP